MTRVASLLSGHCSLTSDPKQPEDLVGHSVSLVTDVTALKFNFEEVSVIKFMIN